MSRRVLPVGTGRSLSNCRVASSATRVRLPCPPLGSLDLQEQLDKAIGRSMIKVFDRLRLVPSCRPRLMTGAFVFVHAKHPGADAADRPRAKRASPKSEPRSDLFCATSLTRLSKLIQSLLAGGVWRVLPVGTGHRLSSGSSG